MDNYQFDIFWAQAQQGDFATGTKWIESIQLGLLLGGVLSFPFQPAFLISSRESVLFKEAGKACFRGNFFAFFVGILFFLFGSSSLLEWWYFIEPGISLVGLFLLFRYATALDASPERFLGFLSLQSSSPRRTTEQNLSLDNVFSRGPELAVKGQVNWYNQVLQTKKISFQLSEFFWFNFKPTSPLPVGGRQNTTAYFYLGIFILWTNPFFWTPLGSFLYAIQFDDPFFRLLVVFSSFISYIGCTIFYFEFFHFFFEKLKFIPYQDYLGAQSPLFQGEVNKMSFVFDTFIATCLSLTILLSVSRGSWRETFTRYSDQSIEASSAWYNNLGTQWINKKLNKSVDSHARAEQFETNDDRTKVGTNVLSNKGEDEWLNKNSQKTFQYAGEYQSPTLKEPVIQYNRSRVWYNLPPLTPYQFEYAVKKYRLSTARLVGQHYLNWSNSFFLFKEKHFEPNYSMSSFLKKFSTQKRDDLHDQDNLGMRERTPTRRNPIQNSLSNQSNKNNLKGYPHFSYARFVPVSLSESNKLRTEMTEYTKLLDSFK